MFEEEHPTRQSRIRLNKLEWWFARHLVTHPFLRLWGWICPPTLRKLTDDAVERGLRFFIVHTPLHHLLFNSPISKVLRSVL
eukprot:1970999-Amphidinium_carterae.1